MAQDESANGVSGSSGSVKFSISKGKQVRTIQPQQQEQQTEAEPEFVTSTDQIILQASISGTPIRPIPRLENTWNPHKRMKNLIANPDEELLMASHEFVSEEIIPAGPVHGVQYGLSIRSEDSNSVSFTLGQTSTTGNVKMDIIREREARARMDKQALEEHLGVLPEPATVAEYDSMPVEKFGEALLAGMGWKSGGGVGKRAVKDVKASEAVRRPDRLGLGAVPAPPKVDERKRRLKPGEVREKPKDLVAAPGADGQVRHRVEIGEKLVERVRRGVYGGKVMSIVRGMHAGLRGEVIGDRERVVTGEAAVCVKLVRSGETVQVCAEDLVDVGSLEEEEAMKKLKEMRIEEDRRRAWLRSQIRVRVVSKEFQKGKLYLKKGRVIDVVSPTVCNILLDESGEIVEGVKQKYLETALPRRGGRVMIVGGKFRGSVGKMVEKDGKDSAVVELEETLELVSLDLDYLAEYTGHEEG